MEPTPSPAGWHPDPSGRYEFRYFNGERWTADVSVHGQRFVDPVDGTGSPAAAPGSFGSAQGWRPAPTVPGRPPRGFAIAAFVVGLVSFLTGWVPFVFVIAAIGAVAALVFGIVALGRVRSGDGGGKGFAIVGIVLAIAAFGAAYVGLQFTRRLVESFDEFIDVGDHTTKVTSCTIDGTVIEFTGSITNDEPRVHSYTIEVTYLVDSQVADTDSLFVDDVAPGATATFQGTGFARDATPGATPRCRIDTVTGPLPFRVDD